MHLVAHALVTFPGGVPHVGVKDGRADLLLATLGGAAPMALPLHHVRILEIFAHHGELERAYAIYRELAEGAEGAEPGRDDGARPDEARLLLAEGAVIACRPDRLAAALAIARSAERAVAACEGVTNLTRISGRGYGACLAFAGASAQAGALPALARDDFDRSVAELRGLGLLVPAIGEVRGGALARTPACSMFGLTRGTPIDRYYLGRFVEEVRGEIRGVTYDLGGTRSNRERLGLAVAEYRAVDLRAGAGVDVVGDVHDRALLAAGSADSLLCFNVLEHLARPAIVAENLHAWLRPGGKAFAMVPGAQRIHRTPRDYWRLMPDGMELLFAGFARRRLIVYGNLAAAIASLAGVAAEELGREELDARDEAYPVAICVVAEKA